MKNISYDAQILRSPARGCSQDELTVRPRSSCAAMWRPAAIRAAQATRSLLPRSVQCHGNGGALARPAGHGPCGAVLRVATAPRGCAALSSATGDGDGQGPDERHQETPQEKKARVLKARLMQGGLREPVRAQHEKVRARGAARRGTACSLVAQQHYNEHTLSFIRLIESIGLTDDAITTRFMTGGR